MTEKKNSVEKGNGPQANPEEEIGKNEAIVRAPGYETSRKTRKGTEKFFSKKVGLIA